MSGVDLVEAAGLAAATVLLAALVAWAAHAPPSEGNLAVFGAALLLLILGAAVLVVERACQDD